MTSWSVPLCEFALIKIAPLRTMRFVAAAATFAGAIVLVAPLSIVGNPLGDTVWMRTLVFYAVTSAAYAALPFVRRGDIAMVGMWLVLLVGIAPCLAGRELSADSVFADMGGVLLAAIPIYIARFRQVAQGDMRLYHRRETEAPS